MGSVFVYKVREVGALDYLPGGKSEFEGRKGKFEREQALINIVRGLLR